MQYRSFCEKGIKFIRIDGSTSERDRQLAVQSFQSAKQVKIALVGILAGGTGLNLLAAHNVVFLEFPKEPAHLLQDTSDESRWQNLNKSLHRASSTVNGKYDAIQEIETDSVAYFGVTGKTNIREDEIPPLALTTEHSAVELMEFPTSIGQNLHPDQASGPVDESQRCEEQNYSGRNSPQKEKNGFHEIAKQDDGEPARHVEAASVINSLRFEFRSGFKTKTTI